ncbi:MAG TPA: hypothetical protein VD969_22165 [Symbiobacteriaceae bacterium]|nr:hypothetical protein [Symbiobacteriaceae bacterium]
MRYHLSGLPQEQVGTYIEHHMRLAGASCPIFSEQAVSALATLTRGVPRLINAFCASCLLDARTRDHKVVDEASVRRVASEFDEADRAAAGW